MEVHLFLVVVNLLLHSSEAFNLSTKLDQLLYDDHYIRDKLDSRYPYLKLPNGDYIAPRDYFNFTEAMRPSRGYLESRNLEEVLYEELRGMEFMSSVASMDQWHYSNPAQEASPLADDELCNKQVAHIESQLALAQSNGTEYLFHAGLRNQQLLRYMDSWARPPSEVYHGHSYWVGSYSRCLKSQLEYTEMGHKLQTRSMSFHFCWAKLRPKGWPRREELVPATSFRAGLCLPEACDTRWANRNRRRLLKLMHFNFSPLHRDRFTRLIHVYCLPDRPASEPLPLDAKIFLAIVGGWICLILLASLGWFSGKLRRLSLVHSWHTFVADNEPVDSQSNLRLRVDLRPIGVVRFVACVAICVGHCILAYAWVFNSSSVAIEGFKRIRYALFLWFMKSLDVHLVIAGLMTSYGIIAKFPGARINTIVRPKVFLQINLARFLRLAPMLVLTLAFMKSLYRHLGHGPMWDYGTSSVSLQGQCTRSSWWRNLLVLPILFGFRGNPYSSECLAVSWYSVADIKLALLAPFIVYLLQREEARGWHRKCLLLAIVSVSLAVNYLGMSKQRLMYFQQFFTYGQILGVNILHLKFAESSYFSVLNRLHTFSCGLWAGYYLQLYKSGRIQHWPRWMRGWCFRLILSYQLYTVLSSCLAISNFNRYGQLPPEEAIKVSVALGPRLDAIVIAILITRLASDLAASGRLMRNTLPLYKLSKLSYCVFLIHSILIAYLLSSTEYSRFDTHFQQLLVMATFTVAASFVLALPLHLLFELPLAELCVKGPLASFRNKRQVVSVGRDKHD